jgi:hypothetical protein
MERIDPIRRPDGSPWVASAAAGRRVERREPGDEAEQRRRRARQQHAPDGHPDADGHIDVEA